MPRVPLGSMVGIGRFIFKIIELVIGVKFRKENLNTRNSFDAIMIILATYFIFPIYSGFLDIFAQTIGDGIFNRFAIEGFRFSFLISSVWLILIALFSKARFSIIKFGLLVAPGLVLGIVLTFLLIQLVDILQGIWKLDEITLFIMTIYPLIFSYFVRSKIGQQTRPKYKPHVPRLTHFQKSVYIE